MIFINYGKRECEKKTEVDVYRKKWEKRKAQEDSKRFNEIVEESRKRLGLEVI